MKRIAILTGASSGMGRELALQLAQWETFDELWVIARRADRLEALKEQVPFPVRPISLDLTDPQALELYRDLLENALSAQNTFFRTSSSINDSSGFCSIKENLRRKAASISEIDLSAEFIVPTIYKLLGTAKTSPD